MELFINCVIFYFVVALFFAFIGAASEEVTATKAGKPLSYPRLRAGLVFGLAWPLVLFQNCIGWWPKQR